MKSSDTADTRHFSPERRRILVADNIADHIGKILEQYRYHVDIVRNVEDVLVLIRLKRPHLLITDNYSEIIDTIRADPDLSDLPVLMTFLLHETARDPDPQYWRDQGANGGLRKPFPPEELLNAVDELLLDSRLDGPRVLAVDDRPEATRLIQKSLMRSGYQVEIASSSEEALAKIKVNRPYLLITDLLMPGMDGRELIKTVRSDTDLADLPILLVTAWPADKPFPPSEFGGARICHKPLNPVELVRIVNDMFLDT